MKRIEKYCESGDRLAATLCDLYDRYSTVTIISVPVGGAPGYYGFGVSVDDSERENAVYIGDHCYQMTHTDDRNPCEACALRGLCVCDKGNNEARCNVFLRAGQYSTFQEFKQYHFEKVKVY